MIFLGIESSCDETSIALYSSELGTLANKTFSQADIHSAFGGVIPEVASRNHIQKISPLYQACISEANINSKDIDVIGVTNSPGLIGALFVGVSFAKGLGYSLKRPVIPINHLMAHILVAELTHPNLKPPYTAIVVSGGHTHIFDVNEALNFKLIGRTLDDAAGEVFDKIAKVIGGPYPGGIFIENLAKNGDINKIKFPIAFKGEVKFSFSGLKTAVINIINKNEYNIEDVVASFQHTIAQTLFEKTMQAAALYKRDKIVIGGGVACNSEIRRVFNEKCKDENIEVFFPDIKRCTDNGEMIAYAASRLYKFRNFLNYNGTAYDKKHMAGLL